MNVKHSTDNKIVPARRNPFAVEHVTKIRFRFEEGNWPSYLKRLEQLNYRAAIVGPRGSGKSTLLNDLQGQIVGDLDMHYVFLPQDKESHPELLEAALEAAEKGKIILVDGLERISVRQKFRLFRQTYRRNGLIVTSHHTMRYPPFNLPTWVRTKTSELLLDYVLSELKMASPEIRAAGKSSLSKHRGNLREVLRDLYDRHAARRFKQ
jgi:hypothetical protein